MNKRILVSCIICAVISYMVVSKSVYYTEKTINKIITFALYAILNNPAFGNLVNPLVIPKLPEIPFVKLKKLVVTGLTTIRSGNDSKITFDGHAINVFLNVQTDRIEADLYYKIDAIFFKNEGVVGVLLDSIIIDTWLSLPTNYTGHPLIHWLNFTRLENFRTTGPLAGLSGILNSNFFKLTILEGVSYLGTGLANSFLKNVTMPWQDEKLKAKLKKGIRDTGFLLAKR